MNDLTQKEFDKLVAIASTLNMVVHSKGVEKTYIEICQGEDEGTGEMMSYDDIYNFIDSVFEKDVEL